MKRLIFILLLATFASGVRSQNWEVTLGASDGLPGNVEYFIDDAGEFYQFYKYKSPLLSPTSPTNKIRLTIVETISNEAPNGNNVIFALSELAVYDAAGNSLGYVASSNADYNALTQNTDGSGLPALNDNSVSTYFHSMYKTPAVTDYHYVELTLASSVSSFYIEWSTRANELNYKNTPTLVGVTAGTNYGQAEGDESIVGEVVSTVDELAVENRLFFLKSNSQSSFTAANGNYYHGSGPLFMQCAESGSTSAALSHAVQFIPAGGDRYLAYWPQTGKFLENSAPRYDGVNGWQYSTTDLSSAALLKISAVSGYFEMQYDGVYSDEDITLYIGAELRDGVVSKMKTFDLEHKNALEAGDYTQGFALPVAFNWSIYNANIPELTLQGLVTNMGVLAFNYLNPQIINAYGYLETYGDHNGYCLSGENAALRSVLSDAEVLVNSDSPEYVAIFDSEAAIFNALSVYMAARMELYKKEVEALLAGERFTEYPYEPGTYPISSKAMLENILVSIADAQSKAGVYSAVMYESIYTQLERDMNIFYSTIIEEGETPDVPETPDEPLIDGNTLFVYLSNGGIEAFASSSLAGEHYMTGENLCIPLVGGEVRAFGPEEYDSCSTVIPEFPVMTSFKFNNKYNPNLHVDALLDSVSRDMTFTLNAIGKWLTPSFNMSSDKAVAYVDTVPQVSKVSRLSFADGVKYIVTYPGCYINKTTKVQDEMWNTVVSGGEESEIPLTADMLSTNKPSTQSSESLANLLDGNENTIFHSTWGSANNATINVNTYIDIALPALSEAIKVYYKCRPQRGYNPLEWEIYAGNDTESLQLVRTLSSDNDGMPTGGAGQEFTSSLIPLGGEYSHIRIVQTRGEYSKNHLAISELRIYNVENVVVEDVKVQDAVYAIKRMPVGNEYRVKVNWLTDNAVSVPRIDIDIDNGRFVTSKSFYLKANFRITGYGVYDNFEDSVMIKGRGNTSWGYSKKPYRLKFDEKVKPFGLTKGKSWVLLANAQSGSLMANAVAMKMGQMAGSAYANHIVPVELYMNGTYMGSYMFTEKVGMANNSVDVDEDLGYLLELDTYYDETYKFRTDLYSLPVNVKEPDLTEYEAAIAEKRFSTIQQEVNKLVDFVANNGDIESVLDMDAYARFMLANDYALNMEIGHPKSTFLFKETTGFSSSKFKFGPIWDFDWGFGYQDGSAYCYEGATSSVMKTSMAGYSFLRDIRSTVLFKKHYYKVWKEFVQNNSFEELMDYIDSYYTFAKSSFENNAGEWGSSCGFDEGDRDRMKEWLATRMDYIYNGLTEYNIDEFIYPLAGDVNCNNATTVHDATSIVAHLNGSAVDNFSLKKADCDGNGRVEAEDAEKTVSLVMESAVPDALYWYNTPIAVGGFLADDFAMELGAEQILPLKIASVAEEPYNAFQFDLKVPDGIFVDDITAGDVLAGHRLEYVQLDMNTYRVVAYSPTNSNFTTGEDVVVNIALSTTTVIEEENRKLQVTDAYIVDAGNVELRMKDVAVQFALSTGVDGIYATVSVKGGDCVVITALESQEVVIYGIDGRLVRKVIAGEGTTRVYLPAGMYVIGGQKVFVRP